MKTKLKNIKTFITYFLAFLLVPSLIMELISLSGLKIDDMLLSAISLCIYMLLLLIILRKQLIIDFNKLKENFTDKLKIIFRWWGIGLLIMMASNLIVNFITGDISANETEVRKLIISYPFFSAINVIFFAPVCEEITFRMALRNIFKDKNAFALASGTIFGLMHISSDVFLPIHLLYIIPYGALGYAFARIYYETESIWSSILAHSFHNFITLVILLTLL